MKKMFLSTGIASMDSLLDGVRLGDNVVWYVSSMEEYVSFVKPFVQHCLREGFKTVYVSIDNSLGDLMDRDKVEVFDVSKAEHPREFKRRLSVFIKKRGLYVHYIFDNLTALKERWKDDDALADFFQTICPLLYELETVAYFSLRRDAHRSRVIAKIRDTTQILIDVGRVGEDIYLQPLKVWNRYAKDMFKPHVFKARTLKAVKELDIERYVAQLEEKARELNKIKNVLRESEEKYRAIFNEARDGIVLIDSETGNIVDCNPEFESQTGRNLEQLKKMKIWDVRPPEKVEAAKEKFFEIREKGAGGSGKLEFQKPDGEIVPIEFVSRAVKIRGQQYLQSITRDITERKRAEEAHIESEGKYRSLIDDVLDKSNMGIFILDSDFKVVWVNRALERFFGVVRDDIIGKDKKELIKKRIKYIFEKPDDFANIVLATYANNSYVESFECHIIQDGERKERWLEHLSQPIEHGFYSGGRIELYYDITERKRAEEKIQVSLGEKEVLLQEIHHRVKNNMQVISSLLKLQSGYIKDKKDIAMLKESQNRMKSMSLIHEKLYQSKDLTNIDFDDYLKDLVNYLFRSYEGDTGKIAVKVDVRDVLFGVDFAIPCGLIINELVSNSLKHAFPNGRKGEIKIALCSIDEDEIELVVSDNGVGIPKDLDFRNTESLGLRLVTILAEDQLQGKIKLSRTKGTKFQIKFKGEK
ncbi:MAG: PAS domain S-box protein [Candidatus Hydrothermarchaeales archaeon]